MATKSDFTSVWSGLYSWGGAVREAVVKIWDKDTWRRTAGGMVAAIQYVLGNNDRSAAGEAVFRRVRFDRERAYRDGMARATARFQRNARERDQIAKTLG